jgi:hypothetical protein
MLFKGLEDCVTGDDVVQRLQKLCRKEDVVRGLGSCVEGKAIVWRLRRMCRIGGGCVEGEEVVP